MGRTPWSARPLRTFFTKRNQLDLTCRQSPLSQTSPRPRRHDTASPGGGFLGEAPTTPRLHPIRQLIEPFASLIFPEFAGFDRTDARTDTPADLLDLLPYQIGKDVLDSGSGEPKISGVLIFVMPLKIVLILYDEKKCLLL